MASDLATMSKSELQQHWDRAARGWAKAREHAEEVGEQVAETALQITTGAAMGIAEEAWGERAVMGLNIPLVVGLPSSIMSIFGVGGRRGFVALGLRSVGNACLTIESYKFGGRAYHEYRGRDAAAEQIAPT